MAPRRSRKTEAAAEAPEAGDTSFNVADLEAAPPPADGVTATHVNGEEVKERQGLPHVSQANTRTDPLAKMKYHNDYDARPQKAAITFDDGKPGEAVRQALKDGGFEWNRDTGAWETDVNFPTREQDRQRARATFRKVAEMRREELGVGEEAAR